MVSMILIFCEVCLYDLPAVRSFDLSKNDFGNLSIKKFDNNDFLC